MVKVINISVGCLIMSWAMLVKLSLTRSSGTQTLFWRSWCTKETLNVYIQTCWDFPADVPEFDEVTFKYVTGSKGYPRCDVKGFSLTYPWSSVPSSCDAGIITTFLSILLSTFPYLTSLCSLLEQTLILWYPVKALTLHLVERFLWSLLLL